MQISKAQRYIELGSFLKNRRNKLKPEQVGLPVGPRRRTPGLRREEVAQLAGVGLTWYTWLEQGREINVSNAVLNSLAEIFMLSKEERRHLYVLANKTIPADEPTAACHPVNETLSHVLETLDLGCCPAYYMDHRWNIVTWNNAAAAVFGDFSQIPPESRNVVSMMFCSSEYMQLFDNWAYHAKGVIARFHGAMAEYIEDPWFTEFVENLKSKNKDFSAWWSLYDVHSMFNIVKKINHPVAGKLFFEFSSFDVSDNPDIKLIMHIPNTDTAKKIKTLLV